MGSEVVHFSPDGDKVACGTQVFLCDEQTDDPQHVDCKRCRRTKLFINHDPTKWNVDVWDFEGEIVDYVQRVSYAEALEFQRSYEDDPNVSVVFEEIAS